jgi:hypothetical protein
MRKVLFLVLICITGMMSAQVTLPDNYIKGYEKSVKGGGFLYHSPQPDVNSSLLLRSIDSVQYISWLTDTLPGVFEGQSVTFIWLFGIDANTDSHIFKLYVNGTYCLSFSNPLTPDLKPWQVEGVNGSSLYFKTTMLDKYSDPMGYALLRLPSSMVIKGKPQQIRIVGESKESRSWYMTFEAGVEESLIIKQVPAVVKRDDGNAIPVLFRFVHLGEPVTGTLAIAGGPEKSFTLETGFNEVKVLIPESTSPGEHTATIQIAGQKPFYQNFAISPPRHFTIYLVQHTHTDIGYTRPQTEILPDHLRYLDYALDFCDLTDSLPDDARFRWTCETSWAVREYLRTRPPSQVDRLKRRVNEGRIELTGLFLNSSDLADETLIAATLQPVREIRKLGFPVKSAMQSDINGVPWCLTDYLSGAGIEYLNMAQNTHRAEKPFDNPTTFWWESPSGNRVLVNRPEHYMWGNSLGILTSMETFADGLFQHLQDITEKGYPYDHYAIQFSGYLTDNSPPSTTACKTVEQWNQTYIWPRLRLATLSEFMDYQKMNHSDEFPVIRGGWPDWWMDGFGSAALQTAYARAAHADYIANEGLMSIAAIMGVPENKSINELHSQITDDIAFYDEHTFGAAESITDPLCENSVVQLGEKESYVWSAVKKNRILREEVMGQVQPFLPKSEVPSVTVFNTLNWTRSGNMPVYIDHQLLPKDKKFRVLDQASRVVPVQPISTREEGTWWMMQVTDVPPLGFQSYRIVTEQEPQSFPDEAAFTGLLENDYYRIRVDLKTAKITGFHDKQWKRELIDENSTCSTGEIIYERLGKNRGQLEQHKLDEFTRTSWNHLRVGPLRKGQVWQSVIISGQIKGCADSSGVHCEIRLYHHEKKVEFCYSMKKLAVTDPEGVYVAFPFKVDHGQHVVEVAGGTMVPGKDQIEGSSADWTGIQNFVSLRSDSGQIVFVSPEIPLVQLGEINLGKFDRVAHPVSGSIFSWVLNNYWTTNFLASQEGELKWTYQVTSGASPSNTLATQFGMENRIPFLYRVFPGSSSPDSLLVRRSFFSSKINSIALICSRPSTYTKGVVFHLRETAGHADSIAIDDMRLSSVTLGRALNAVSATEVNVLEEPLRKLWENNVASPIPYRGNWLHFKPYETRFLLFRLPE